MGLCENNYGFRSLRSCRETCLFENGERNQQPTQESHQKRFQYKVVSLNYDEYSMSSDGVLTVVDDNFKTTSFSSSDYFVDENLLKVCYPFNAEFYACNKYQIPSNETEFIDHFVLLKNDKNDVNSVDVGSFFVYKNHTILCDSDSSLTTLETIHFGACVVSALCLLLTLIAVLKRKLKLTVNLGLFCHICFLFIGYTLLSIKLIVPVTLPHFCLIIALLQQFCFLSAFFWLNVQSASLYETLKTETKANVKMNKCYLVLCLIYAFGVPLLITLCTMLAEVMQFDVFVPYFQQNCWFLITDRATSFLFYYGPMTWTLVVNIFFFLGIVWHLRLVGKNVHLVNKKIHKQLFVLCIKLMVVMCFCWFAKIAFWGIGILENIWSYMDMVTYFQGIFVFLVYACKETVVGGFLSYFKSVYKMLFATRTVKISDGLP